MNNIQDFVMQTMRLSLQSFGVVLVQPYGVSWTMSVVYFSQSLSEFGAWKFAREEHHPQTLHPCDPRIALVGAIMAPLFG